jgi:hypothetical protein
MTDEGKENLTMSKTEKNSEDEIEKTTKACLGVLEGMPDNESRTRVMAMVAIHFGEYDVAMVLIESGKRFAAMRKELFEMRPGDD